MASKYLKLRQQADPRNRKRRDTTHAIRTIVADQLRYAEVNTAYSAGATNRGYSVTTEPGLTQAFIDLTDTPVDYGTSGQVPKTNGSTGLTWGWVAFSEISGFPTPTSGGILVGNSTPTWSTLAVGSSGRFLQSDGSGVTWSLWALPLSIGAAGTVLQSTGSSVVWGTVAGSSDWSKTGTIIHPTVSGDDVKLSASEQLILEGASGEDKLVAKVSGDSYGRLNITATGIILFGDGSTTPDCGLSWYDSKEVAFGDSIKLRMQDGRISWTHTSTGDWVVLWSEYTSESYPRYVVWYDGVMGWGDGTTAPDVKLGYIGNYKVRLNGRLLLFDAGGQDPYLSFAEYFTHPTDTWETNEAVKVYCSTDNWAEPYATPFDTRLYMKTVDGVIHNCSVPYHYCIAGQEIVGINSTLANPSTNVYIGPHCQVTLAQSGTATTTAPTAAWYFTGNVSTWIQTSGHGRLNLTNRATSNTNYRLWNALFGSQCPWRGNQILVEFKYRWNSNIAVNSAMAQCFAVQGFVSDNVNGNYLNSNVNLLSATDINTWKIARWYLNIGAWTYSSDKGLFFGASLVVVQPGTLATYIDALGEVQVFTIDVEYLSCEQIENLQVIK